MAFRKRSILPFLAALALLGLSGGPPAQAQTWLAPAYPGSNPLGPDRAKGAVIWSHGRSVNSEDSEVPSPAYMTVLRDDGWDAFRFNRMRVDDTLEKSAAALAQVVQQLKQKGYHKVALAGQSFGGFLALMAADASDQVDSVIATAPAAYGSFQDYYGSWRSNATKLYPLLEQVRSARVMVFFFHGDDFDPGGRGDRAKEILAQHRIAHVVVDQPPQLTTHWAATTPLFTRRFGGCIQGFIDATSLADDARCRDDALLAGAAPDNAVSPIQGDARPRPNGG
jgi:pimeloyl-ACP methyl ester carboxylesterase